MSASEQPVPSVEGDDSQALHLLPTATTHQLRLAVTAQRIAATFPMWSSSRAKHNLVAPYIAAIVELGANLRQLSLPRLQTISRQTGVEVKDLTSIAPYPEYEVLPLEEIEELVIDFTLRAMRAFPQLRRRYRAIQAMVYNTESPNTRAATPASTIATAATPTRATPPPAQSPTPTRNVRVTAAAEPRHQVPQQTAQIARDPYGYEIPAADHYPEDANVGYAFPRQEYPETANVPAVAPPPAVPTQHLPSAYPRAATPATDASVANREAFRTYRREELGLFDPDAKDTNDDGFIEVDGKLVFCDVFSFTERLRNLRELDPVRENALVRSIPLALQGRANWWWATDLTPNRRDELFRLGLPYVIRELEQEFRMPEHQASERYYQYSLTRERFTRDRSLKRSFYRLWRWAQAMGIDNKWVVIHRMITCASVDLVPHLPRYPPREITQHTAARARNVARWLSELQQAEYSVKRAMGLVGPQEERRAIRDAYNKQREETRSRSRENFRGSRRDSYASSASRDSSPDRRRRDDRRRDDDRHRRDDGRRRNDEHRNRNKRYDDRKDDKKRVHFEKDKDRRRSEAYVSTDNEKPLLSESSSDESESADVAYVITEAEAADKLTCRRCHTVYPSRNALFKHIRAITDGVERCYAPVDKEEKTNKKDAATTTETPPVISVVPDEDVDTRHAVYSSLTFKASMQPDGETFAACADSGCATPVVSNKVLHKAKNVTRHQRNKHIMGLGSVSYTREFAKFDLFALGENAQGQPQWLKLRTGAWVLDNTPIDLLLGNSVLGPHKANIDYTSRAITFADAAGFKIPFCISRRDSNIIRKVSLAHSVTLEPSETKRVTACWSPLPEGRTFMMNGTHPAACNAMVTSQTPPCVVLTNPTNRTLKLRRKTRLGTITESYESGMVATPLPRAMVTLAVAASKPSTTTQEATAPPSSEAMEGCLLTTGADNKPPLAATSCFAPSESPIPAMNDEFDVTGDVERLLFADTSAGTKDLTKDVVEIFEAPAIVDAEKAIRALYAKPAEQSAARREARRAKRKKLQAKNNSSPSLEEQIQEQLLQEADDDETDTTDSFQSAADSQAEVTNPSEPAADSPNIMVDTYGRPPATHAIQKPDESEETVLSNGVHIFEGSGLASRFGKIVQEFPEIWEDSGLIDIPEKEMMRVPLVDGWNNVKLAQKQYPASHTERELIDKTYNELHRQGRVEWVNEPTPFATPLFVAWRFVNGTKKGRVVADLRALNRATIPDHYPLPSQEEIINSLIGKRFITVVDASAFFHQFGVHPADREKFTVISHRGLERSTVAMMGFRNSPAYVQRFMDKKLLPYKDFARCYIDDIVIFSDTGIEHEQHLRQVFQLFKDLNLSISPKKSWVGYDSVQLLGYRVDAFGLCNTEERLKAIARIKFPRTLKALENYIGMTGFMRHLIPKYAVLVEPLQKRKTSLLAAGRNDGKFTTGQPSKRKAFTARATFEPTELELEAFNNLQAELAEKRVLRHFDRKKRLFIQLDAAAGETGYGIVAFHLRDDYDWKPGTTIPATAIQPILFLSKVLTDREKLYGPSELEVGCLAWAARKLRVMLKSSELPVTVLTDHASTKGIVKKNTLQTTSTDRANRRLIYASTYLSEYDLEVFHIPGRLNAVPDALSRLPGHISKEEEEFLKQHSNDVDLDDIWEPSEAFAVNAMWASSEALMDPELRRRFREGYRKDISYEKTLQALGAAKPNEDVANLSKRGIDFEMVDGLLYHIAFDGTRKLCIPKSLFPVVLAAAHDEKHHFGRDRMMHELSTVQMHGMTRAVTQWVKGCRACDLNRTDRARPRGEYQSIPTVPKPMHTIAVDWIVKLPPVLSANTPWAVRGYATYNSLLTVTDKFSKRTLLIPGHGKYSAAEWAAVLVRMLTMTDWGLPKAIISDRDARFQSEFWKQLWKEAKTRLLMTAAYHPQANGLDERKNQTVEIAIRYHTFMFPDSPWSDAIIPLQWSLNNAFHDAVKATPNELLFGFKLDGPLEVLSHVSATKETERIAEQLPFLRESARKEAELALSFAAVRAKERYDAKRDPVSFDEGDRVYLRLHRGYALPGKPHRKFSQQRAGPFKVLKRVGRVAYKLEFPPAWKIHPVISVDHLSPGPVEDEFERTQPPPGPVEDDTWEVERIVAKRKTGRGRGTRTQYLVRWQGFGAEEDNWVDEKDINAPDLVKAYEDIYKEPKEKRSKKQTRSAPTGILKQSPSGKTKQGTTKEHEKEPKKKDGASAQPPQTRYNLRSRR